MVEQKSPDNVTMLFYLVKDNIGMLNYTFKEKPKGWESLPAIAKEQFTVFANKVSQLLSVDQTDIEENPKKDPPEWTEWRKEIFKHLKEKRNYKLTAGQRAGEAKTMSWMFRQGYTPEKINKAFDMMYAEPFWANKPLTLMTVAKQIGAMFHRDDDKRILNQDKFSNQKFNHLVRS